MTRTPDYETGLTAIRIREVLIYDLDTGDFTHRIGRGGKAAGTIAGTLTSDGYWQLAIDGRVYLAHRIAWVYMTGEWPTVDVDHRDTVGSNNKWLNLRLATKSQNNANTNPRCKTSKYKGVHWSEERQRWCASIHFDKVHCTNLGRYEIEEDAARAYDVAALDKYGEFARLNFPLQPNGEKT